MLPGTLSVTMVFLAGFVSFASPCVLPLVPAYLAILAGVSLNDIAGKRWTVITHAVLFVLGFTILFVILGAAATALGRILSQYIIIFQRLGGFCLVLLGLHLLGVVRIPFLYQEHSLRSLRPGVGYLASFFSGMFFVVGWVPCVGPVLAAVMMLAGNVQTVSQGAFLLAIYALGLGIPFIVIATFAGYWLPRWRGLGRYLRYVEVLSGLLVISIGLIIFFDLLVPLSHYGSWLAL